MPRIVHGKTTRSPAFSLIEVLLSMFLILALVTILFAASGTYRHSRNSQLQTIATKIASREIENLRKTAFASLPGTGAITGDPDLPNLPSGTAERTVANYPPNCSPTCSPDIKQITVTVNWTEGGVARTISQDTIISKNGL